MRADSSGNRDVVRREAKAPKTGPDPPEGIPPGMQTPMEYL